MEVDGTHQQAGTGLVYGYSGKYSVAGDRVVWDAVLRLGKIVEAAFDQFDVRALPSGLGIEQAVVVGIRRAIDDMEPSMLTISRAQWTR